MLYSTLNLLLYFHFFPVNLVHILKLCFPFGFPKEKNNTLDN
jgi:hypothetical protein